MNLDLIVTTIDKKEFNSLSYMNIQSDAIICNQCGKDSISSFKTGNSNILFLSSSTRGKSINQNLGIIYSNKDILLFSDDDLILEDGYENQVITFFEKHPDADAVKFYCESLNSDRKLGFKKPLKTRKVRKTQIMSAGTPMLAVRRDFLIKNNIWFNITIGPGTSCPNGEDGVFFSDLFKNNVKFYVCPTLLAYVKQDDSTWYKGINEEYFVNCGLIYRMIYGDFSMLFIIRKALIFTIKRKTKFHFFYMIKLMKKGKKTF